MTTRGVGLSEEEREALAGQWLVFRRHHPAGAYLPVGQLDGDCHGCGEAWPCSTVSPILARIAAAHTADLAAQVARVEALADACQARLDHSPDRVLEFWLRELRAALSPAQPDTEGA